MRNLTRCVLCTLFLLLPLSAALAQSPPYSFDKTGANSNSTGEIHGIVSICNAFPGAGTIVYLIGTSFSVDISYAYVPEGGYAGEFTMFNVPEGSYELEIKFPNSLGFTFPTEVVKGLRTEYDFINICRDLDNDGWNENRDCNDQDFDIKPNATEICGDNVDNNCDGLIDASRGPGPVYTIEPCVPCDDIDQDGFKAGGGIQPDGTIIFCPLPRDCNDRNNLIKPGAAEICDNMDNNCDSQVDEGFELNTDENCGACGNVCVYPDTCVVGVCSNQ